MRVPFKLSSACPYERAAIAIMREAERRKPPQPPLSWRDALTIVGQVIGRHYGGWNYGAIGGTIGAAA
jgi:hypothetical protein